jgi:hypothetical protein
MRRLYRMNKIYKRLLSFILVLTLFACSVLPSYATDKYEEEYLADLRIIYAEDYSEALQILDDLDLDEEGFRLLKENLNEGTGKIGVFLAYSTTTDVDNAITDIAVMEMGGGYKEGNYRAMIEQSYNEYLSFGENYITAISYFNEALDAGHYLTELAFRQLNFYNVVTEGIDDEVDFEGERIGDIFYNGIDVKELATMFMEGNSYALSNIRSLLAMGVSYNDDGSTYLQKVGSEAERYSNNPGVYDDEDYEDIARLIAPVIKVFGDMFKELELHKDELNYEDENLTDLELKYLEYKSIATLMGEVNYLNGKTLYDFCHDYLVNLEDVSDIYPFVAALNEGQLAMVKVNHFYDVVRYSVIMDQSDDVDAKLAALEEEYSEHPFNVYSGVDRTIYRDTFALTSEAYRADAFTESGLTAALWGGSGAFGITMNVIGIIGATVFATGAGLHLLNYVNYNKVMNLYEQGSAIFMKSWAESVELTIEGETDYACNLIDMIYMNNKFPDAAVDTTNWTFKQKYDHLAKVLDPQNADHSGMYQDYDTVRENLEYAMSKNQTVTSAKKAAESAPANYADNMTFINYMYIIGGLMALISAIRLGYSIWHYYHPDYDDIPTALVDLIETPDGDRYIKYDVVYEAEERKDGNLIAADLNAFAANRWNALYYTRSYEAGKPLLADTFDVSYNSNIPAKDYVPVHRFGEIVSYNLNKYNFKENLSIYLSVKQSEKNKSAVADVPELIASVFSTEFFVAAGGIGIVAGIGGTIGVQEILKRKKTSHQDVDLKKFKE